MFAPTALGTANDLIVFCFDFDCIDPQFISLHGNGIDAGVLTIFDTVYPQQDRDIPYGDAPTLETTYEAIGIVNSSVYSARTITDIFFSSGGGTGFTFSEPLALPITLAPGESTIVITLLMPSSDGPIFDEVIILSDDPVEPLIAVTLSADGVESSALQVTDTLPPVDDLAMPFPILDGIASIVESVTLYNPGPTALSITGISLATPGIYTLENVPVLRAPLPPGGSIGFDVRFAPDYPLPVESFLDTIAITSDSGVNPIVDVALSSPGRFSTLDSDGDGIEDGTELNAGTDPLDPLSIDPNVYVDIVGGDDTTGFGTQAAPWATPVHAVAHVFGNPVNTISINIAEGTYPLGGSALSLDSHEHLLGSFDAATWTRPARSAGTASRTVDPSLTVLDAQSLSGGLVLDGLVDTLIDGLTITGGNTTGVIIANLDSSNTIENSVISNNSGGSGPGGLSITDSDLIISASTISGNDSGNLGGGMEIVGGSPLIIDSLIIDNKTSNIEGGAVLRGSSAIFDGVILASNTADFGAGAMWITDFSDAVVSNSFIIDNRTGGLAAGGIAIVSDSNSIVTNNVISGNSAPVGVGGGVFLAESAAIVSNNTISNNSAAAGQGGGLSLNGGVSSAITNNLFSENTGVAIADFVGGSTPVLTFNLFHDNPDGDYNDVGIIYTGAANINTNVAGASDNVDGDPLFVPKVFGLWTADPVYDPLINRTTFTDASAPFLADELVSEILNPSADPTLQAFVTGNSTTTVEVAGDFTGLVFNVEPYQVVDYSLIAGSGSTALDTGRDTSSIGFGAVVDDILGVARGFDGDGIGAGTTGDGSEYDIGAFEAAGASITVLFPNGGETLFRGTTETILWTSSGAVGPDVSITLHKSAQSLTITASTPDDGSFTWNVPPFLAVDSNYTIEITCVSDPLITDTSDATFSIQ